MQKQIAARQVARGLEVTSPYGSRIIAQLKAAGARWDATTRVWVVPIESADPIRATLRKEFGQVDGSDWVLVELRPIAPREAEELRWGPWWLASGSASSSPLIAGVLVVAGRLGAGGSRRYPTVTITPETALRIEVPRDWFDSRPAEADDGWAVTEVVALAQPVADGSQPSRNPVVAAPVAADPSIFSTGELLRELRVRLNTEMDTLRRTPGQDASARLDRCGTLLAALEALE